MDPLALFARYLKFEDLFKLRDRALWADDAEALELFFQPPFTVVSSLKLEWLTRAVTHGKPKCLAFLLRRFPPVVNYFQLMLEALRSGSLGIVKQVAAASPEPLPYARMPFVSAAIAGKNLDALEWVLRQMKPSIATAVLRRDWQPVWDACRKRDNASLALPLLKLYVRRGGRVPNHRYMTLWAHEMFQLYLSFAGPCLRFVRLTFGPYPTKRFVFHSSLPFQLFQEYCEVRRLGGTSLPTSCGHIKKTRWFLAWCRKHHLDNSLTEPLRLSNVKFAVSRAAVASHILRVAAVRVLTLCDGTSSTSARQKRRRLFCAAT